MNITNLDLELCLCKRCADAFYRSPIYILIRIDPIQVIKDECSLCRIRRGYDYRVIQRKNQRNETGRRVAYVTH